MLIAASTASGKTEAAFLPALTHLLTEPDGGLIVYISPLKALINDQFARLERLCENLDVPVWRWHGDVPASSKRKFLQSPCGVLLITPESLEATLCNRGTSVAVLFARMVYFIVDELHAFIGNERGKQLQSLMHRIEVMLARPVPRIALSATLGDMDLAVQFLRPERPVARVDAPVGEGELRVIVKGFEEPLVTDGTGRDPEREQAPVAIAKYLFGVLRGSNNLVFPNSRREVERYTHLLNTLCGEHRLPQEFWPHHGNLSKELREETEAALKQHDRPATAVCTNTLELGIDLGAVRSVVQIGTPPSVASLRQRLGRSGRREGEPAILRGCVVEYALDGKSDLATRLRLDTAQTTAAVSLLLDHWFEPPVVRGAHYSTLVQQLLSSIAQYGGLQAAQAFRLLCGTAAPFSGVSKEGFAELLRALGQEEVLTQDHAGLLLHGSVGDRIVNHYSFYAAFASDDEFRIVSRGETLGTLPVTQMLVCGQRILFGGRTWLVESVDEATKTIQVAPGKGGAPPMFNGSGGRVHTRVRQRMRELYVGSDTVPFLDATAQRFLEEGRDAFRVLALQDRVLLEYGNQALLVTWLGDSANEALACLMTARGIHASANRLGVEVTRSGRSVEEIESVLRSISTESCPSVDELLSTATNLTRQKWDALLSPHLLRETYASSNLGLDEAVEWLSENFAHSPPPMASDPLPTHPGPGTT